MSRSADDQNHQKLLNEDINEILAFSALFIGKYSLYNVFCKDEWNARISWGFDDGLVSIDGDWLEVIMQCIIYNIIFNV